MTDQLSVHVAIPVYNNAWELQKLIPALLKQKFTSITVLDDASTDESVAVVQQYPTVRLLRSDKNVDVVANRNQFLRTDINDGWILFLDTDMEVVTTDIVVEFKKFLTDRPNAGIVVGKILDASGKRKRWNYGYDMTPWRGVFAFLTYHPAKLLANVPWVGKILEIASWPFTTHLHTDETRKVDWAIEACLFVETKLFQKLGGFDTRYKRWHEGPDICLRARKTGRQVWYCPDIVMQDHNQQSRTSCYRLYQFWRSMLIYFWKFPSRFLIYYFPRP